MNDLHLLSVNSLQQVTLLGLYVVAMLENIVTFLSEEDDHCGYTFCWFGGSLQTFLGHEG